MQKTFKIIAIVLISIVAIFGVAVLGLNVYDKIKYKDFYAVSAKEFKIPGINDGFIPQGFDYIQEEKLFIASGYMTSDKPSRIYVINEKGDNFYTELKDENGNDFLGHAGGVTAYKDYVYVANTNSVVVFSLKDILNKDIPSASQLGEIDTLGVKPSFCFTDGTSLFVGSFHREENYKTPEKFHLTTPSGEINKGCVISFAFNDDKPFLVDNAKPTKIYSIPSKVQGITLAEGKMILSTSYGLKPSIIYVHDLTKIEQSANLTLGKTLFDCDAPVYFLDDLTKTKTISAPPMSEEIAFTNGKLYIYNESACNKYILGKFYGGNYLYSTQI